MRPMLVALAVIAFMPAARAAETPAIPSWYPQPDHLYEVRHSYKYQAFETVEVTVADGHNSKDIDVKGRHWTFNMYMPGGEGKDDKNDNLDWAKTWAVVWEKLKGEGFRVAYPDDQTPPRRTTLEKGEGDNATYVYFNNRSGRTEVEIVEQGGNPYKVTLKAPADRPEKFGPKDPLPYITPLPNSKLFDSKNDHPGGIIVEPEKCGGAGEERGTTYFERDYQGPKELSGEALAQAYIPAMKEAGWDFVCDLSGHQVQGHYTRNNRDIWVTIRPAAGGEYRVLATDSGAGIRTQLLKGCKAQLYGVNFDFDKATLRPDSEPALNQVLALMKDQPKIALEIGGHTDNVGKRDYNMKLSDARAASVRQWLVGHGIDGSRLTSHGYGDTQPLVANDSDEHRAKNRRVELKRAHCG